ncbi:MAG TPA: 3-oxoacyl-[acyl-carrier-protein] reductase [Rectinema sp.]|jgi:3-oxoacyl-[acyl-carrier protein] reductase|nr:3-oxoacyl-[acyl-carrier-protein] reductase [Spirochaetia bacterium]MDI9427004.1 3-oxoacyl-[acyl-carrier-protein] reductase [Spirochaetota bacterium]NLH89881.1 3-oxoacyl-[acyl-carrier-protein] reductase [Treponema sp.]OQC75257.1 MAG: 3-oxoacyl-(acyl-carrier-protein) reductase FabG [Spirochaetes bacterium ADurb.Bin001]HNP93160.1 3-oxoacyl-[acyl-carrier-protein] reductase [Rectinema sp.]
MEGTLSGQVCLVTGASRGIGLAIATRFKQEGAIVYGLSRTKAEADIDWISCDVTDELSVESAIDQIFKIENRIDVLVNNAGMTKDGLIMRMKTEDWEAVLNANLRSAFFLSRAVSRIMLKQRSGCILNMSSVVGLHGNGGQANYAASKAGLIGFTKSLAKELGSRNIRVNAIAPGYVETSMTQVLPETAKENLKSSIPLGRPGVPEDIAEAALFLCSSHAAYITGVVLNVDGGMGM